MSIQPHDTPENLGAPRVEAVKYVKGLDQTGEKIGLPDGSATATMRSLGSHGLGAPRSGNIIPAFNSHWNPTAYDLLDVDGTHAIESD